MSEPLAISFAVRLLNSCNHTANYIDMYRIRRPEGRVQTDTAPRKMGASASVSTIGTDDEQQRDTRAEYEVVWIATRE